MARTVGSLNQHAGPAVASGASGLGFIGLASGVRRGALTDGLALAQEMSR